MAHHAVEEGHTEVVVDRHVGDQWALVEVDTDREGACEVNLLLDGTVADVVDGLRMVYQCKAYRWVAVLRRQDITTTISTTKDLLPVNNLRTGLEHLPAQCLPCQLAKPSRWIIAQAHRRQIMG